jgi:dipeptidyl aminopeptidase/acylaminoacyl peptidase
MRSRIRAVLASVFLGVLVFVAPAHATFPGQNGKFSFSSDFVYTANPDFSGYFQVTHPSESDPREIDFYPKWSPDGQQIAFNRGASGVGSFIYVVRADGTGLARVGTVDTAYTPAWSPDGSKLVFEGCAPGCWGIYIIGIDGSGLTKIAGPSSTDEVRFLAPKWSPDGTKIAFLGYRWDGVSTTPREIYTADVDGTDLTNVTNTPTVEEVSFDWSPDGSRIVFDAFVPSDDPDFDVYVMKRDGSSRTDLTPDPTTQDREPLWSPDSSRVLFLSSRSAFGYYLMNPDGSSPTRLGLLPLVEDWQAVSNRSPDCSAAVVSRAVLTTHNRKLVAITLDGATDPDGDPVTIKIDGVTQDEPVTGRGDATSPDAIEQGDGELRIRAERDPRGDGRVYGITFTATDGRGGSCSGTATVSVPRKKRKPAIDSAPPSYDSLAR